ncbi:MAG: sugar phosphate nucleotidyltransferase, partial [Saprospiraceae bacterium]
LDPTGYITGFVEKPTSFVSDLAIVGIYYFQEAEKLREALQQVISQDIREKNEYQLTTALEILRENGLRFATGEIEEWLDCGNKEAILHSNARMLEFHREQPLIAATAQIEHSVIVPPCYVGEHATVKNSVIGPYVSGGNN